MHCTLRLTSEPEPAGGSSWVEPIILYLEDCSKNGTSVEDCSQSGTSAHGGSCGENGAADDGSSPGGADGDRAVLCVQGSAAVRLGDLITFGGAGSDCRYRLALRLDAPSACPLPPCSLILPLDLAERDRLREAILLADPLAARRSLYLSIYLSIYLSLSQLFRTCSLSLCSQKHTHSLALLSLSLALNPTTLSLFLSLSLWAD